MWNSTSTPALLILFGAATGLLDHRLGRVGGRVGPHLHGRQRIEPRIHAEIVLRIITDDGGLAGPLRLILAPGAMRIRARCAAQIGLDVHLLAVCDIDAARCHRRHFVAAHDAEQLTLRCRTHYLTLQLIIGLWILLRLPGHPLTP